MKLLRVWRDHRYLYIDTDEGTRQQSLRWSGVRALEEKCEALIGREIIHSTWGDWDPNVWFQDVKPAQKTQQEGGSEDISSLFPTTLKFENQTSKRYYGPPGTGKTKTLIDITKEALAAGINSTHIGYFAFTNVAAKEALGRIVGDKSVDAQDYPGFSTLHSFATKIGGTNGNKIATSESLSAFDPNIHINEEWMVAGDFGSVVSRPDHPILNAYSRMLNRMEKQPSFEDREVDQGISKLSQFFNLSQEIVKDKFIICAEQYWEQYLTFKKAHNLADFNDVIVNVVNDEFPDFRIPTFELLIVDEAQDLSNLQWALIEKLRNKAKRTIIAGDDDQAILEAFGANPQKFVEFDTTEEDKVLSTSHRVPEEIKEFVDRTSLARLIRTFSFRKEKTWHPNPDAENPGEIQSTIDRKVIKNGKESIIPDALKIDDLVRILRSDPNSDWLVMSPTRATGDVISNALKNAKIPHYIHRKDVLDPAPTEQAIKIQTVHTSKGMGAQKVAFVKSSRGDYWMDQKDPRLEYVALTRAIKTLIIVNE